MSCELVGIQRAKTLESPGVLHRLHLSTALTAMFWLLLKPCSLALRKPNRTGSTQARLSPVNHYRDYALQGQQLSTHFYSTPDNMGCGGQGSVLDDYGRVLLAIRGPQELVAHQTSKIVPWGSKVTGCNVSRFACCRSAYQSFQTRIEHNALSTHSLPPKLSWLGHPSQIVPFGVWD